MEEAAETGSLVVSEQFVPSLLSGFQITVLVVFAFGMGAALLALMIFRVGTYAASTGGIFARQIEALVLLMVIVALVILGVSQLIDEQGIVSILAAIAGYGVGRASVTTTGGDGTDPSVG